MGNENKNPTRVILIDEPTFQEYLKSGYEKYAGFDAGGTVLVHPSDLNTLQTRVHPGYEAAVGAFVCCYEARSAEIKKLCKKSRKARSKNK